MEGKQKKNLEKVNQNRQKIVNVDPSQALYKENKRNASQRKTTKSFVKVEDPSITDDIKFKTENKIYLKNILKPQCIISGRRKHNETIPSNNHRIKSSNQLRHKRNR
ncbi:hypothetical protein HHI36_022358 [Cryptolaemus montrouzieri]|uniref:Uncharacterized protein n=1 Tax=Cryptolaemus montrouzieri TaxID=559131 RepID=A0ABD2MZK4_9CUCU